MVQYSLGTVKMCWYNSIAESGPLSKAAGWIGFWCCLGYTLTLTCNTYCRWKTNLCALLMNRNCDSCYFQFWFTRDHLNFTASPADFKVINLDKMKKMKARAQEDMTQCNSGHQSEWHSESVLCLGALPALFLNESHWRAEVHDRDREIEDREIKIHPIRRCKNSLSALIC